MVEDFGDCRTRGMLFHGPAVVPGDGYADGDGDDGVDQAVVDAALDVVALEQSDAVFGDFHAAGLAVSDQHFHAGFEAGEFFENVALKVIVSDADDQLLAIRVATAAILRRHRVDPNG